MEAHTVFDSFMDVVQAFGHKIADTYHYRWSGCHIYVPDCPEPEDQGDCYGLNIEYVFTAQSDNLLSRDLLSGSVHYPKWTA